MTTKKIYKIIPEHLYGYILIYSTYNVLTFCFFKKKYFMESTNLSFPIVGLRGIDGVVDVEGDLDLLASGPATPHQGHLSALNLHLITKNYE